MIETMQALRSIYPEPKTRSLVKQLDHLDKHCTHYIGLAPFLVLATVGKDGRVDASPRGGAPGFVKVVDDKTLHLPDALGNNRLDSFTNIVQTGKLGVIFFIPGMDETLRVNGNAQLSFAEEDIAACTSEIRAPKLVVRVAVEAAYLHCAKAFLRSRLWEPDAKVDRAALPTAGRMISDQTGIHVAPETQEEMVKRYQPDL